MCACTIEQQEKSTIAKATFFKYVEKRTGWQYLLKKW
jgi:hypothetical protein